MEQKLARIVLPVGLLAINVLSASAGQVTVTGANGGFDQAGFAATATTTTPSETPNTATAIGGNGGQGSSATGVRCVFLGVGFCFRVGPGGRGAPGGAASATATASIAAGAAWAVATATGGNGGLGGFGTPYGPQGYGGNATASSSAAGAGPGSVTSSATATAGANGLGGSLGGNASASANATANVGNATSNTYAYGNSQDTLTTTAKATSSTRSGNALAQSLAQNQNQGSVRTTAYAPGGGSAGPQSAKTIAEFGSGPASLAEIASGQIVSDAISTWYGPDIGVGAMSEGVGERGYAQADFTIPYSTETLYLNLLANESSATGFKGLTLSVFVDGKLAFDKVFTSLAGSSGATSFFTNDAINLGSIASGASHSIELEDTSGGGFSFTYDFATSPVQAALSPAALETRAGLQSAAVPEASTWVMMLIGLASLGWVGSARPRIGVKFAR